ncbi:hypothetical protein THALO_20006 [Tenacibaculum halocynthiae]
MGNILTLQRKGHLNTGATSFGTMDNLAYTYDSGNKLLKVTDTGNKTYGFKDGTNTGNDFSFDTNGNQVKDLNKGVTSVVYNHLNMPTEIKFNNSSTRKINYTYDADGTKIRKITNDNGSITTTDYIGNYVYENNILKQISHPEGYIEPNGNSWQYVYQYIDIWGNTRITYADDNNDGVITASSEIRREQNYYPGGLEHRGYNTVLRGVKNNLKTYQKQEFTEDLGLNTHEWRYRVSDPATLRFWQVDPLAEDYVYNSTYAFQENKMGMGVELEGLELAEFYPEGDEFKDGGQGTEVTDAILDEIPLVGEIRDISDGNYVMAAVGIVPFGKKILKGLKFLKNKLFKKADNVVNATVKNIDDGVVFSADLSKTKSKKRAGHRNSANKQLNDAMKTNSSLKKKMEKIDPNVVENTNLSVKKGNKTKTRKNPQGYEWDHNTNNKNQIDLRSKENHAKKTAQDPNRVGGYAKHWKKKNN